jgi:predicted nuclease of restriction endonuclease-like (RecB) superfamily
MENNSKKLQKFLTLLGKNFKNVTCQNLKKFDRNIFYPKLFTKNRLMLFQ